MTSRRREQTSRVQRLEASLRLTCDCGDVEIPGQPTRKSAHGFWTRAGASARSGATAAVPEHPSALSL
jgi:hypothetical protein